MKYNIETIKKILRENPDTKIIYFWGHTPNQKKLTSDCLSQWYDCYFIIKDKLYHTTEQYMMASKAMLFGDFEIYQQILQSYNPHDCKKLGRKIRGFEPELWDIIKYDIVTKANKAKFSQNETLKEFLLSTGNAILVEASPFDKIWGIGLDKEQAEKGGIEQWNGENLLGCALMETRDWLRGLNDITSDDDISASLLMWQNGLGNMGFFFNGDDHLPAKTKIATSDSWSHMPMPEEHLLIKDDVAIIPESAMNIILRGHIPEAMEDHWFMYCDNNTIRYFRSWTGFCIYEAHYEKQGDNYKISSLIANRNHEQYYETNKFNDYCLFMFLLISEIGEDASLHWDCYTSIH